MLGVILVRTCDHHVPARIAGCESEEGLDGDVRPLVTKHQATHEQNAILFLVP
jgi:hypothetical protein